jgi:nitric oxide reductase activation protein
VFQLDLFQQDAFQDGTNDVVELRIDTAFQPNAFQSDGFQENAAPVEIPVQEEEQVTGGWPIPYWATPKRRKRKPVDIEEIVSSESIDFEEASAHIESIEAEVKSRKALRSAEQRDQRITAQLRAIYAEQDALERIAQGLQQAEDDEDLALILAALI